MPRSWARRRAARKDPRNRRADGSARASRSRSSASSLRISPSATAGTAGGTVHFSSGREGRMASRTSVSACPSAPARVADPDDETLPGVRVERHGEDDREAPSRLPSQRDARPRPFGLRRGDRA